MEEGCNFDDIFPHFLALLILPTIKSGPYHHGVEWVFSEKASSDQCAFYTENVTEHRTTRTRPVVAANGPP